MEGRYLLGAVFCFALGIFSLLMNRKAGDLVGVFFGSSRDRHPYIRLSSGKYVVPYVTAIVFLGMGVFLGIAAVI